DVKDRRQERLRHVKQEASTKELQYVKEDPEDVFGYGFDAGGKWASLVEQGLIVRTERNVLTQIA
ncbi:hypothetical protein LTR49_025815, partial [Elasticomyces elasticus]